MRESQRSRFGRLLRDWRGARRMSQLALSLEAEVSARHLSYIETGRAQPSRAMVLRLAQVLEVPLRDRNALLDAAGFAPEYRRTDLDAPEMTPVRDMIAFMFQRHEPYWAAVLDRVWTVRASNRAYRHGMDCFIDSAAIAALGGNNHVRLALHPDGLRRFIVNWREVAGVLVRRLHREAAGADPASKSLLDEVMSYPGLPRDCRFATPDVPAPLLLPVHLRRGDLELKLFSTVATLGTAQDIMLQDLKIECFYPADKATDLTLRRLASSAPM